MVAKWFLVCWLCWVVARLVPPSMYVQDIEAQSYSTSSRVGLRPAAPL